MRNTVTCCDMSHVKCHTKKCSFISMISLTASFFVVEIVVGYVTNSMALVADSFHMLSDVVSLFVGYIALRYSRLRHQNGRYTFGWARSEVLGALVNSVFLVALCFSILVEALKRMVIPEHLDNPRLVLITGGVGLFVNLIGLVLFHQHGHGHSHGGHGHSHGGGSYGDHQHGKHGHNHSNKEDNAKQSGNGNQVLKNNERFLSVVDEGGDIKASLIEKSDRIETKDNTKTTSEGILVVGNDKDMDKQTDESLLSNGDYILDHEVSIIEPRGAQNEGAQGVSASQLNMRGVYLHVLGDALGSVIVMISALIVLFVKDDWTQYVDPTMSIIMVLIILKTSIPLLKESSMILMQTAPTHINIEALQSRLVKQIPDVIGIHEFHIWQLAGSRIIASAHVRCKSLPNYMAIANQLKEFFHNEGIHSTTIQPEFVESSVRKESEHLSVGTEDEPDSCVFECEEECFENTCCGSLTSQDSMREKHDDVSGESDELIGQNDAKMLT